MKLWIIVALLGAGICAAVGGIEGIEIRPNERVVFIGDLMYGPRFAKNETLRDPELLWASLLARHADKNITFIKVCHDSASTAGVVGKLDTEVLPWKPTLVIINRGIYDVGYQFRTPKPDFGVYRPNMGKMVKLIKAAGARIVLCSPTPQNNNSTPEKLLPPNDGIAGMAQDAQKIAAENGAVYIDLFIPLLRGAVEAEEQKPPQNFWGDPYVYFLNAHLTAADAILAGMGFAKEQINATVNAQDLTVNAEHCRVSGITMKDGVLGMTWSGDYCFVPVPDAAVKRFGARFNPDVLFIKNLQGASYDLLVDGVLYGTVNQEQMAGGIKLGERKSPLYTIPYPEYLAKADSVKDIIMNIGAARSFKLPAWIQQPDFEQQREQKLARLTADLEKSQAELRALFKSKAHHLEFKPR